VEEGIKWDHHVAHLDMTMIHVHQCIEVHHKEAEDILQMMNITNHLTIPMDQIQTYITTDPKDMGHLNISEVVECHLMNQEIQDKRWTIEEKAALLAHKR